MKKRQEHASNSLLYHMDMETMTSNTFLDPLAITNDVQLAKNKLLQALSCAARCAWLQWFPLRIITSTVLIWLLMIWRSGECYESRSNIGTKLDVNTIVFGKTLNTIYLLWRSSYPREKCGPSFFTHYQPQPLQNKRSNVPS
jgi:hypothetical protein